MTQQDHKPLKTQFSSGFQSRWMALDVGEKTIGIAISDPLKMTAQPLTTLKRSPGQLSKDVGLLDTLLRQQNVSKVLIGRPCHLDGRPSTILHCIEPLFDSLQERPGVEIEWVEERLSSKEAENLLIRQPQSRAQKRHDRHMFAAALILQWYIAERPGAQCVSD